MVDKIKNALGFAPRPDYAGLMKQGAIILDVRRKGEYEGGTSRVLLIFQLIV